MDEGSICIVYPGDEKPHMEKDSSYLVHYQHGNVELKDDNISVAFVFRVSPHITKCNVRSNRVLLKPESIYKSKVSQKKRGIKDEDINKLYSNFQREKYHKIMMRKITKIFGAQ